MKTFKRAFSSLRNIDCRQPKSSFLTVIGKILLSLSVAVLPVTGCSDSRYDWSNKLIESKGKNMNDVAIKVAELHEKEKIVVRGLDFSPDGKHLAVVSISEKINIWDWKNARIVRTVEKPQGASDGLSTEPIRYSPDGRLFAACHSRAVGHVVIRIWDTDTWEIVHEIADHVGGTGCNAIGFTPDGKSMIRVLSRVNQPGDNLIIYNIQTWEPIWGGAYSPV